MLAAMAEKAFYSKTGDVELFTEQVLARHGGQHVLHERGRGLSVDGVLIVLGSIRSPPAGAWLCPKDCGHDWLENGS